MKGMVEYLLTCIEEVENEIEQDLLGGNLELFGGEKIEQLEIII